MRTYEIRHKDLLVATIDHSGHVQILSPDFMPYGLELTSSEDFDVLLQNIYNFYHWCAGRLLPYGRRNATAMLNSVAFSHGITDKARAQNALGQTLLFSRCLAYSKHSINVVFIVTKEKTIKA